MSMKGNITQQKEDLEVDHNIACMHYSAFNNITAALTLTNEKPGCHSVHIYHTII